MSVTITIKGTPIDFPSSGESPNWAPAVIEFAQATEEAIASAVGPYDIPNRTFTLSSNGYTNEPITGLSFPNNLVRAANIKYSVTRAATGPSVTKVETGNMLVVYDGSAWVLARDYVGDALCTFDITSSGQVIISTVTLGGTYTTGKVSFSAQALIQ